MNASRVVFCKSGKDRTAMACTLEQALFLRNLRHKEDDTTNRQQVGAAAMPCWGVPDSEHERQWVLAVANQMRGAWCFTLYELSQRDE